MIKKIWMKIYVAFLLMLPMGLYILILRKFCNTRMTNYVGVLGKDPKAYKVFYDMIMIDLDSMQI